MKFLKIYFLEVEKFCGKIIFPSAPVCCILNDRSLTEVFLYRNFQLRPRKSVRCQEVSAKNCPFPYKNFI